MYEQSDIPVQRIAVFLNCSRSKLFGIIKEQGWQRRCSGVAPVPPQGECAENPRTSESLASDPRVDPASPVENATGPAVDREALARRLRRAVERELEGVDRLFAEAFERGRHIGHSERAARTLASLTRTLAAVMELEPPAQETDEQLPRDLDELRRELSRRVDLLRQRRAAGSTPCGGEPGPS
jgi:hypothetical protein